MRKQIVIGNLRPADTNSSTSIITSERDLVIIVVDAANHEQA
jgi:hypothetical protein